MSQTWGGSAPSRCEVCDGELKTGFVDGKTLAGPWAIMCLECHRKIGIGCGTGRGQKYILEQNGGHEWVKVEG